MRRTWFSLVLAVLATGAWASGCSDDEPSGVAPDGGSGPEVSDAGADVSDAGDARRGCGDAKGAPPRMLLSMNNVATSELVAFDIEGRKVDGRYTYDSYIGLTSSMGTDPYLLQQEKDIVARLDAERPWEVVASWNVRGDDARDGGHPNASPNAIVVPSCDKGYVLRYNRNAIAVIDTNEIVEAGPPSSFLDLSSLLQADDGDGNVEPTAAVYVPSRGRIYALLANIDLGRVALDGYTALCASTSPTLVGIDAVTGQIVSLGGTGPGGSIALGGYNPILATGLHYDEASDRLLVMHAGCNVDDGGGVAGAITKRGVEEVDLATGQVRWLLSLDDRPFPSVFAFVDAQRAAISFFGQAFLWDPRSTSLGAEIPGGLDFFAAAGPDRFVGTRSTYLADGGRGPLELVSVPVEGGAVDAGAVITLGQDPFTDNSGFVSAVEVWPQP